MEIDLTFIGAFGRDPLGSLFAFFLSGGWALIGIPVIIFLVHAYLSARMHRKQEEHLHRAKGVLLAIDLPRLSEQTPRATENIFVQLAAVYEELTWKDRVWNGKMQERFSFEIASIDGHAQFFVWVPEHYQDLIEAAFYSQYPDAEIIAVRDYTELSPHRYPNGTHDLWGAELVLAKDDVYPLRTYPYFEDKMTKEVFKDPMAAILELLNKIHHGEQAWIQIIVSPTDEAWKEKGEKIVSELIGREVEHKPDIISSTVGFAMKGLHGISRIGAEPSEAGDDKEEKADKKDMSPGERVIVEAIEEKISKLGFECKIRLMYIARKEMFHEGRGVAAFIGVFNQFSTLNLNRFKAVKAISSKKREVNASKNHFLHEYVGRLSEGHEHPFILNTEELATLYHLPVEMVKAPLMEKSEAKRAPPPFSLPTA
ncbi:MAG: hypothetical protein Q7S89_02250 [bacterium]|nr:hypothetical protein [bacterium]